MPRTIAYLFDTLSDAGQAIDILEKAGVPSDDISVVGFHPGETPARLYGQHDGAGEAAAKNAGTGAAIGGAVGVAGGLLGGLASIAIPGLGPVLAVGWLVGAIGGAAAGAGAGVVVGLTTSGVHRDEAELIAEGVRRGGALVSARIDEAKFADVEAALSAINHVDLAARGAAYRQAGWPGFDETAQPVTDTVIDR